MSLQLKEKYRLTHWGHPDDIVETRDCRMCYKYWLGQESIRLMEKSLQDSWIEVGEFGHVALFVWKTKAIKEITPEEEA